MPTPLNESDTLSFFHDYGRLSIPLGPSGTGGAVVLWEVTPADMGGGSAAILVYQAVDGRQILTNISDLTPAQIANLGLPAIAHGQLYYLPGAIIDAIGDLPTNLADEAAWLAAQVGRIAAAATTPLLGGFGPILIGAAVVLALIYLPKTGSSGL